MQLAKKAGANPRAFAKELAARLAQTDGVATRRGRRAGLPQHPARRRRRGRARAHGRRARAAAYGHERALAGVTSTWSSSRRTRPARCTSAACAGRPSATASPGCFRRPAPTVTREYYFNDHGAQIDRFARSLLAAARRASRRPRTGTAASYIADIAERVVADACRRRARPATAREEAHEVFRARGVELHVRRDQASPARLRRRVRRLLPRGLAAQVGCRRPRGRAAARARAHLRGRRRGLAAHHRRSATTATASIIRSNGEAAYIAGDIAYYLDKRERGFDRVVIMLGADHHGYIGRHDGDLRRVRGHPARQPRDPHRAAGQPGQGRRAGSAGRRKR